MENDRGLTKVKRKHSKHVFLTLTHMHVYIYVRSFCFALRGLLLILITMSSRSLRTGAEEAAGFGPQQRQRCQAGHIEWSLLILLTPKKQTLQKGGPGGHRKCSVFHMLDMFLLTLCDAATCLNNLRQLLSADQGGLSAVTGYRFPSVRK